MSVHELILNFYVCVGMFAVFLCFGFMMPFVGNVLVVLFSIVMGEKTWAKMKGIPSGTEMEA